MHSAKIRNWLTGGIVLAAIILVAAWFLLIAPIRAETAEFTEQAEAQEDMNVAEAKRIAVLKAQFENIDEFKKDLAKLRTQMPQTLEHSEFQRQLAAIADEHDVVIAGISVSPSTELRGSAATPPADTDDKADDDAADGTSAPAPSSQFQNFHQVSVSIDVQGTYRDTMDFLADLQTINPRLFLVLGLDGTALEQTDEAGGLPARADGDLQLVVNGQMYVMADGSDIAWTDEDLAAELPTPSRGANPLVGG